MKTTNVLPENYKEILKVDLQNDKKLAFFVNFFALLVFIALFVVGYLINPISITSFNSSELIFLLIGCVGIYVYLVLHELVHGIFIRIFSKRKAKYGITLLYAYAGSDAYFSKSHYIIIALAPVIILGAILLALSFIVPTYLFWTFWLSVVTNFGGAMGDIYVTIKFLKLNNTILVLDTGTDMTVYDVIKE